MARLDAGRVAPAMDAQHSAACQPDPSGPTSCPSGSIRSKVPVSNDPYQPPRSSTAAAVEPQRRWAHVVVAFLSAFCVPAALAYGTLVLWSGSFEVVVRIEAITTLLLGACLSAAAVYRHKRIPLWGAALVGILVAVLLAIAPSLWSALLDRSGG